jgi:uncharacterized membrane protein YedE/YeeE
MANIKYLILGAIFGIILTKSEVISWFRIQEMFRFDSFHMYGIIGSAIVVAALFNYLISIGKIKSLDGNTILIDKRPFHRGAIYGGIIFGFGWAFTGACPGPLFALIGNGYSIISLVLFFALVGTWFYGYFQNRLPH